MPNDSTIASTKFTPEMLKRIARREMEEMEQEMAWLQRRLDKLQRDHGEYMALLMGGEEVPAPLNDF